MPVGGTQRKVRRGSDAWSGGVGAVMGGGPAEDAFAELAELFLVREGVWRGVIFGRAGLRWGTRFFAVLDAGRLIVKLPRERVSELDGVKVGETFAPYGRALRQWLSVPLSGQARWVELADEALEFVQAGG